MTINAKKITELINSSFLIVVGWLIVVPLSFLVRKQKGLFVVVGRTGNNFADNTKYFYLYLQKNLPKDKSYFISDTKDFSDKAPGFVKHPSIKSMFLLMRAEFIIIDYSAWYLNFKYHLSIKAKKIQLWHGISSKKIELSTDQYTKSKLSRLRTAFGSLRGQIIKFHLLSSTSKYYSNNLYKNSLRYKVIKEFGQPRNDVLFREPIDYDLSGTDLNILSILKDAKRNKNSKIILYTPTYRANLSNDILDYFKLNEFAKKNNFIFVIKHHVLANYQSIPKMDNVLEYDKRKDIYPLMSISDAMITDYSSIYVDYLLLDKPVIFYIPDYDEYRNTDTSLRGDYLDISPGYKCYNQEDLQNTVVNQLINMEDNFKEHRKKVLAFSYDYTDGNASKRIYDYLVKNQ